MPALGNGVCAAADQDCRLWIHLIKAGTLEGLSEPKSHWHTTMTLQGQRACWGSSQGTARALVTPLCYEQLDSTNNKSSINKKSSNKYWL